MAAVASRFDRLGFDSPRCEAAKELVRLAAARDGLVAKLDALDAEQRDAGATVARLADELAELERSSYSDGKVDPAEREQAEQALADARRNHQASWAERRDGLRRAIADADAELHRQIAARFTDLVSEVRTTAGPPPTRSTGPPGCWSRRRSNAPTTPSVLTR